MWFAFASLFVVGMSALFFGFFVFSRTVRRGKAMRTSDRQFRVVLSVVSIAGGLMVTIMAFLAIHIL